MHIAVLGAGAWGTALAAHAARHHQVMLLARDPALANSINKHHQNPRYLPDAQLPETLIASTNLAAVLEHAKMGLTVIATPLGHLASLCKEIVALGKIPQHLLWLCKGVEPGSLALPHQVIARELSHPYQTSKANINQAPTHFSNASDSFTSHDDRHKASIAPTSDVYAVGTLSGPSFAEEVVRGLPCALVAASQNQALQALTQRAFHHHNMRVYGSTDVIGVELGGAVKNVLAIASGISDGLNLGLNARAALLTRGLGEMTRLGLALGGKLETFLGLAGMGDLVLTATGNLSRNRTVGLELAKKQALTDILQKLGHVAEGVYCAQAVQALAHKHQVDMPICITVADILAGKMNIHDAPASLLARDPKVDGL